MQRTVKSSLAFTSMIIYQMQTSSSINTSIGRTQWQWGLRRGSADARLLELRVWIPPGHGCLSLLSVVCYRADNSSRGVLVSVVCYRADNSSRGVLVSVVCPVSVIAKPRRMSWPGIGWKSKRKYTHTHTHIYIYIHTYICTYICL